MDPNVDIGDEALKHILYEQMKHSVAFDSEVKHYLRTPADRAHRFLMSAIDRLLELDRVDRNRKAQVQGQERGQSNKVALTAASPENDQKGSGGYPATVVPTTTPKKAPLCIWLQTGESRKEKLATTTMSRCLQLSLAISKLVEMRITRSSTTTEKGRGRTKEHLRKANVKPRHPRQVTVGVRPTCAGTG